MDLNSVLTIILGGLVSFSIYMIKDKIQSITNKINSLQAEQSSIKDIINQISIELAILKEKINGESIVVLERINSLNYKLSSLEEVKKDIHKILETKKEDYGKVIKK